jgi:hypothetical protein
MSFPLRPSRISRTEQVLHTHPWRIYWTWPSEDEKIVKETSKGTAAERCNHWNLAMVNRLLGGFKVLVNILYLPRNSIHQQTTPLDHIRPRRTSDEGQNPEQD